MRGMAGEGRPGPPRQENARRRQSPIQRGYLATWWTPQERAALARLMGIPPDELAGRGAAEKVKQFIKQKLGV